MKTKDFVNNITEPVYYKTDDGNWHLCRLMGINLLEELLLIQTSDCSSVWTNPETWPNHPNIPSMPKVLLPENMQITDEEINVHSIDFNTRGLSL